MSLTLQVNAEAPDDDPLVRAAGVLQSGGVVVYPTDTLYGLGALAMDSRAVDRIHVLKRRETGKPILVLAASREEAAGLASRITSAAEALMSAFWPGPLTLVFPVGDVFPPGLNQGGGSLGIRVPSSPLCLRLLALTGGPITSTSTNFAGAPALLSVPAIRAAFGAGVDLYLDAGEIPARAPSTVVDVTGDIPRLLRAGAITAEALKRVTTVLE
jgi:L-threonylcarbamoyladenylate synthase